MLHRLCKWDSGTICKSHHLMCLEKYFNLLSYREKQKDICLVGMEMGFFAISQEEFCGGGVNFPPSDVRIKSQWEQDQWEWRPAGAEPDACYESNLWSNGVLSLIPSTQGCTDTTSSSRLSWGLKHSRGRGLLLIPKLSDVLRTMAPSPK